MDAQQAGHLRQEGVHRGGEDGHRGEVAEDASRRPTTTRSPGKAGRGQGRGQGPGDRRARRARPRTSRPRPRRRPTSRRRCPSRSPRWQQEQPGQAVADPGGGRRAQAGTGRAGQPRGGQAPGRPGDGRRRGHRASSWRSPTSRSSSRRARRQEGGGRARRHGARRVPPGGEGDPRRRARREAAAETTAGVAGMQGAKGAALAKLVADKGKAKSKDETKRAEVTAKIQSIFAATEADVKKILDGIDPKVEAEFEKGEAGAKATFEAYVAAKMSAYKKDRYGGWLGGLRWAKDKLLGMPDKVNEFYDAGRELYLKEMDGVISRVADIVGTDLTAAKTADRQGQDRDRDVREEPAQRPQEGRRRRRRRRSATSSSSSRATSTTSRTPLVDTLATKYVEARKGLDERIEALQAENKGLVDKAIGAIKAVINTIRELAVDAHERAGPRGRRDRRHHQGPDRLPRQPHRRRQGRHPQVLGQHRRPPEEGPDGLALRGARRGRHRAARHLRPQGHRQAARVDLRPDLGQHPQPAREADRREGDGRRREGRRHLPDHQATRASAVSGRCWSRRSATSRR